MCRWPGKSEVKFVGLIDGLFLKLLGLSLGEEGGILGVVVKCVNIWRNIGGEGGFLARN